MRKLTGKCKWILAVLLVTVSMAAGCNKVKDINADVSDPSEASHKISVVATVFPYYDFARAIGGEYLDVTLLLPPGRDSHSFEPTAQDLLALQSADIFLYNGGEMETWVEEVLEAVPRSHGITFQGIETVDLLEEAHTKSMKTTGHSHDHDEDEEHDEEEEHDHDEEDEHHHDEYDITAKADAYDENSPYFRWTATLSAKLGMDETYGKLKKLKVNKRSTSGYVLSLTMVFEKGERTIEKENEIRYALGKYLLDLDLADGTNKHRASSVPSACFEIKSQKKGTIVLTGGGFGHGIGMSQYGADAMGKEVA